ncbi:MAG: TATA-box-binding protein [Candidatus Altiarchaeales archaeon HGW-Altiarchaeales-3]|nr:MAG: TATA-box-binding protein [Candidatus Altiarchaeales archaeon HGW-Altiarchaeales-3]
MEVKIENIVSSITLDQPLNIEELSEKLVMDLNEFMKMMNITREELAKVWEKEYKSPDELPEQLQVIKNPGTFPGVICKIPNPKTAMLIFRTGKIICSGARSKNDVDLATEKLIELLKLGEVFIKEKPIIEVQNIVASAQIDFKVNLEMAALDCEGTEYEPEQFPGLILRLEDPKTVMLIFRSGKMIITGAKTTGDAKLAAEGTYKAIKESGAIIKETKEEIRKEKEEKEAAKKAKEAAKKAKEEAKKKTGE